MMIKFSYGTFAWPLVDHNHKLNDHFIYRVTGQVHLSLCQVSIC